MIKKLQLMLKKIDFLFQNVTTEMRRKGEENSN